MSKLSIIIILLCAITNAYCKTSENYYIELASKSIKEILKIEGFKILNAYNNCREKQKLSEKYYNRFRQLIINDIDSMRREDVLLLLNVADIIGNNDKNLECGNKKWNNYLTYTIFVSALEYEDQDIRSLIASKILIYQCREYLKAFNSLLKKRIDSSNPYFYELFVLYELNNEEKQDLIKKLLNTNKLDLLIKLELDSSEKEIIKNGLKKSNYYEYRAHFGDKEAETILLEKYDSLTSFEQKIKYAEALGVAKTDKTIKMLMKMLDDTAIIINSPGVTESIRNRLFRLLKNVFSNNELFDSELKAAMNEDRKENDEGRNSVNQYFIKVANWIEMNYKIDLPNLKRANYFLKGYLEPIRIWK